MSEYYDALASAVANLKPADQPARYAFYDRARRMVLQRLQSVDPPMADADIRTEMNAFNAAIRQLENDIVRPQRPAPCSHRPARRRNSRAPACATGAGPAAKAGSPHCETPQQPAPPKAPRVRATRPACSPAAADHGSRAATMRRPVSSLDIPPEFVGEATPRRNSAAAEALSPRAEAARVDENRAAAQPSPATDKSRRLAIAVVAAALVVGVLGAGAYALWGVGQAPVRTGRAPRRAGRDYPPRHRAHRAPAPRPRCREPERPTADGDNMPYILRRQLVYYRTTHPPGTVVISKSQNFLYVVRPNSTAMRYTIGMAPDTSEASGLYQVSRKDDAADGMSISAIQNSASSRPTRRSRSDARRRGPVSSSSRTTSAIFTRAPSSARALWSRTKIRSSTGI